MLSTDQLRELALFNGYQAMQAQIMAAQAQRAADDLAQQVKRLTPESPPAAPVVQVRQPGGVLTCAHDEVRAAGGQSPVPSAVVHAGAGDAE